MANCYSIAIVIVLNFSLFYCVCTSILHTECYNINTIKEGIPINILHIHLCPITNLGKEEVKQAVRQSGRQNAVFANVPGTSKKLC